MTKCDATAVSTEKVTCAGNKPRPVLTKCDKLGETVARGSAARCALRCEEVAQACEAER